VLDADAVLDYRTANTSPKLRLSDAPPSMRRAALDNYRQLLTGFKSWFVFHSIETSIRTPPIVPQHFSCPGKGTMFCPYQTVLLFSSRVFFCFFILHLQLRYVLPYLHRQFKASGTKSMQNFKLTWIDNLQRRPIKVSVLIAFNRQRAAAVMTSDDPYTVTEIYF